MPKILAGSTSIYTPRVVFVSSEGHRMGNGVDFTDIENPDPEKYETYKAYSQTKSANILTAIELSKRANGKIIANSLHPGSMCRPI